MTSKAHCFLLLILVVSFNALALDEGTGDEAPEPDVGLSSEVTSMEDLDIREITFDLAKGKPVIDGVIDEEFWAQSQVEIFELKYELYPTRLAPAPVRTEAKVAVTESHVYVAFIAHDPNVKDLRSAPREHDGTKEDDYVSIIMDPSGQQAKKYEFRVNPHGSLSDVLQDTISDRYIYDWDTEWTGEAKITETGYNVEISIPVSSIRQPEIDKGEESKGIVILKRTYPRRTDSTLANFFIVNRKSNLPEDVSTEKSADNAEAAEAIPVGGSDDGTVAKTPVSTENNFQITPYYIYHFDEERDIGGSFEQVDEHRENEMGFDAKYQIDNARSLTVTVNPNFTEVEADIARQSINNSFVVFKPEKRDFFRDATEYYSTLLPMVYSRNIIKPEIGASFLRTGTTNSSGAFWVRDEATNVIMPDTFGSDTVELDVANTSAAFRHQYSKNKKTIGLLATFRSGDDGYHNAVAGFDGLINLGVDDKLRYQVMYSDTNYPQSFAEDLCETSGCTQSPSPTTPCLIGNCDTNAQVLRADFGKSLTDHGLRLSYRHDGPESLFWANYFDVGPDFRADLGFARKVDIRAVNFAYGRKWYLKAADDDKGKSRIRVYAIGNHHRSHTDNNELESGITLLAEFRGTHQTVLRVARRHRELAVNRIDQSSLATGDNAPLFQENYWFWYYQIAPSVKWTIDLNGKWGETADADNMVLGDMAELNPKIKYRLKNLEYSLEFVHREFDVDDQNLYREELLTFGLLYRKNKQISHRLLLLDDKTLQRTDHPAWLDKGENKREIEKSLEYTYIYEKSDTLKLLAGFKLGREQENNSNDDLINREIYIKLEKRFDAKI